MQGAGVYRKGAQALSGEGGPSQKREAQTRERRSQSGEETPAREEQLLSKGAHCWVRPCARWCIFLEETFNCMRIGQRTEETWPNQAGGSLKMKNGLLFEAEGAMCSKWTIVKVSVSESGQLRQGRAGGNQAGRVDTA